MNPCENCKRKECPAVCYPRKDYERHLKRSKRRSRPVSRVRCESAIDRAVQPSS